MTGVGAARVPRIPGAQEGSCCCPVCGTAVQAEPLEHSNDSSLYACSSCDLHFWYPVETPGAEWYEAAYQGRDSTAMPLEPGHLFFLNDERAPKKGRLLDVGCGTGNFLAAARDRGFEVTGIEQDRNAVQFAKDHYGLMNIAAELPEDYLRLNNIDRYDIVTFFEVLEHQKDPQAFLETARSFLVPNGYIGLSVPNRNRWQIGMDTLDYPPNHLTRWSPRALQSFLEHNGFEVISIRPQRLTVWRAAQMLSALTRIGAASYVAHEKTPTIADFASLPIDEVRLKNDRLKRDKRQRLAASLAAWKVRFLTLPAFFLLPFLRLRGFVGLYLYCLARRKRPASESDINAEPFAEAKGRL